MFNLSDRDNLDKFPAYGFIWGYVTASKVTPDETGEGNHGEEYGWVDSVGSTEVFDNRNYATPVVSVDLNDPDAADYVSEALETLGAYADGGYGTYIGQDETLDADGNAWTYCMHFVVKHFHHGTGQYIETTLLVV